MSVKRLTQFALLTVTMCAAAAFAQKPQTPGTHITVSKTPTTAPPDQYPPMYNSIQKAVNAARIGQVIEILDDSVYAEQVTIDGRETSPWPGVDGGKNGITIRYVPPAGTPVNSAFKRPTIKYQDKTNQSPKNYGESQVDGEMPGNAGNFDMCGAVRIVAAEGVTIEGIAIDGDGAAPFAWDAVWDSRHPLAHGNAAINLVKAGTATIRNCDLKNAFIGVYIKDRNTGGVFASPNASDLDVSIPLSGFGKVGHHLVEHNRIHNNSLGIFFESAWDLPSSVRYNLIYNNFHTSATKTAIAGKPDASNQQMFQGAIMFKDMVLAPMAIYNNTFFRNANNLLAGWKVGAPHLIFNNIFGESNGEQPAFLNMEHRFPNRMHSSLFAANERFQIQNQNNFDCDNDLAPGGWFIGDVAISNNLGSPAKTSVSLRVCNQGQGYTGQTQSQALVLPGSLIPGGTGVNAIPSTANVRWLEMTKRQWYRQGNEGPLIDVPGTYALFESTDTANAKFLWPKWSDTLVIKYIKNKGWEAAGIRNADGEIADIGAISSANLNNTPQPTLARVKPTNVVMVTGTSASASFYLNVETGTLNNPKIKLLRWVGPLPFFEDNFGGSGGIELPASAIRTITPPAGASVGVGTNSLTFTIPALGATDSLGFFEIIIEGTDANGKTVTSDVGFLPYRKLNHRLKICVDTGNGVWNCGDGTTPPSVNAGKAVQLRVTAEERNSSGAWVPYNPSGGSLPVSYRLLSHSTARMWREISSSGIPRNPLDSVDNLQTGQNRTQTYTVYFTRAGDESISAAGKYGDIPLIGELQLKVNAGAPDRVAFIYPVPWSDGVVTIISGTYDVQVMVQDKFDNPVNRAVPVDIVSSDVLIGDVDPKTVSTDSADGIARFTARVTNGKPGDTVYVYASISVAGASKDKDTAALRVGRVLDLLYVFFYESGGYWGDDFDVPWEDAVTGTRRQVWVKVINMGEDDVSSKSTNICVTPSDPNIKFSATEDGAAVAGPYLASASGGVATFWITSDAAVDMASLTVSAKTTASCEGVTDNGFQGSTRSGVTFKVPAGGVSSALVKGDGYARPNYVEITFTGDGGGFGAAQGSAWLEPDSVILKWPSDCADAPSVTAKGADVVVFDSVTVRVTLDPSGFPEGYSAPMTSSGSGALLEVYGAINKDVAMRSPQTLIDGVGPLIGRTRPSHCGIEAPVNPTFDENKTPGETPFVLRLQITEPLLGGKNALDGNTILMSSDEAGTGETELTVTDAALAGGVYTLTLATTSVLAENFWIKLNPAAGLVDAAGAPVHPDNRRVQIKEMEAPANMVSAQSRYTTADNTGVIDYIYITFDKGLTTEDIPAWFAGGKFTFTWAGVGVFNVDDVAAISVVSPGTNTIRIDVAAALTSAERAKLIGNSPNQIKTTGTIAIDIEFSKDKSAMGWKTAGQASDEAKPVLVWAVLQMGTIDEYGTETPDTLILTYSERPAAGITGILEPVKYASKNSPTTWTAIPLQPLNAPTTVSGSDFYEMKYVVPIGTGLDAGDSLRINEIAGVTDNETPGNVQDNPDNRRVPLEIKANIKWDMRVKKNPFKDFTVVEVTPNAKGGALNFDVQIRLYDNMGKIVVSDTISNTPGGTNAAEWRWDGRNSKGRYVGTGTYLCDVVCIPKTENVDKFRDRKPIGFVRGVGK